MHALALQLWRARSAGSGRAVQRACGCPQHLAPTALLQVFGHALVQQDVLHASLDGSIFSASLELGTLLRAALSAHALLQVCAEAESEQQQGMHTGQFRHER